jgi:NADPH-dependent 7-cyano-7-deazaguanine reductase QueF
MKHKFRCNCPFTSALDILGDMDRQTVQKPTLQKLKSGKKAVN